MSKVVNVEKGNICYDLKKKRHASNRSHLPKHSYNILKQYFTWKPITMHRIYYLSFVKCRNTLNKLIVMDHIVIKPVLKKCY